MKQFNFKTSKNRLTKKHIIVSFSILLILTIIGMSFAVYNLEDKDYVLFSSSVGKFTTSDVKLTILVDGVEQENFPAKGSGYAFGSLTCENGSTGTWNSSTWELEVVLTGKDDCIASFVRGDGVIASVPELYQGMIPVTYDNSGNVIVADESASWYDYGNREWANAVLVDNSNSTIKAKYFNDDMSLNNSAVGNTIPMSEILQMYVWIPRYSYKLFNASNSTSSPQAIEIEFVTKGVSHNGTTNGTMLTHPAFMFGNTQLNGFWVGKFEMTGTSQSPTIKPNLKSLTNLNVSTMFNTLRGMDITNSSIYGLNSPEIDTHMMKNMEWGAVAYLTNSIYGRYVSSSTCISSGCEIWINNINTGTSSIAMSSITGCSGSSVSASAINGATACASGYDWKTNGVNASTTGNMYGIYDMSGGAWDCVMSAMRESNSTNLVYLSSGFTSNPDAKYFDSYSYVQAVNNNFYRYSLGDATRETLTSLAEGQVAWYKDFAYIVYSTNSWVTRGGDYLSTTSSGIFSFGRYTGAAHTANSFRAVLSAS